MKTIAEIYQALLDGKTLKNKNGGTVDLETSGLLDFSHPEDWEICETKWRMQPAEWSVARNGDVIKAWGGVLTKSQKFGMQFHTEKQAEKAKKQMKRANLLRYWVSTMQDLDKGSCYIKYDADGDYIYIEDAKRDSLAEVYMKRSTAKKITAALNNGELKL
jgi:hypothetical protein